MNTPTSRPSLWTRAWNWFKEIDEAVNYDSSQNTVDQLRGLQQEVTTLTLRVQQIESDSDSCSKAAA